MEGHQKTLDGFVRSRKRPTNDDGFGKKVLANKTEFVKPSRKLSFDCSVQQTIKKQKVS